METPAPAWLYVGCAGWSIPSEQRALFPAEGSHLKRYASVFPAVEINSSFHRLHRESTYRRWAASVPGRFRFSVKLWREITHAGGLRKLELLDAFLPGPLALGPTLGALLVQLPPRLAFDPRVAQAFFAALRRRFAGAVVCEPRHASWFSPDGEALLEELEVGRAGVDPAAPVPQAAEPRGWGGVGYFRLHGSPEMYRSAYSREFLAGLATRLRSVPPGWTVWCIFDNTARGAAIPNALTLLESLGSD